MRLVGLHAPDLPYWPLVVVLPDLPLRAALESNVIQLRTILLGLLLALPLWALILGGLQLLAH